MYSNVMYSTTTTMIHRSHTYSYRARPQTNVSGVPAYNQAPGCNTLPGHPVPGYLTPGYSHTATFPQGNLPQSGPGHRRTHSQGPAPQGQPRRSRSINATVRPSGGNPARPGNNAHSDSPYAFANSLARTPSISSASATGNPQPRRTALQRQREQMRAQFTFPNGEVFTPRPPVAVALAPPVPPAPVAVPSPATVPTAPAQSAKRSPRKKLGRLFRGMLGRDKDKDKDRDIVPVSVPVLALPVEIRRADKGEDIVQRLEREWDTVHLNTGADMSLADATVRSASLGSLSVSSAVSSPGRDEARGQCPRTVRFAPGIFVGETFAQAEYLRAEPEEIVQGPGSGSGEGAALNSSAKMEVNAYKQYEMFVHPESRRYTHFFA